MFTVWVDPRDVRTRVGDYLAANTHLGTFPWQLVTYHAPNTPEFGLNPSWLQQVLQYDRPSVMISWDDCEKSHPTLGLILVRHTPMGQNAFQHFTQAAGCTEAGVPLIWIQPEEATVDRATSQSSVEVASPLLWRGLLRLMEINAVPALRIPWPVRGYAESLVPACDPDYGDFPDSAATETQRLFRLVDLALKHGAERGTMSSLAGEPEVQECIEQMRRASVARGADALQHPASDRSGLLLDPDDWVVYLARHGFDDQVVEQLPTPLRNSDRVCIVRNSSHTLRADPYAGTAALYDYVFCRTGRSARDRSRALIVHFEQIPLSIGYRQLLRDSPNREHRLFLSLGDLILFQDGLLRPSASGWTPLRTRTSAGETAGVEAGGGDG